MFQRNATMPGLSLKTHILFSAITIVFVIILGYQFSVSDRLAGFFDDSATYLIMADIYSPYKAVTPEPFYKSYQEYRHLPPAFPLVLALLDASQNIRLAHTIVLVQFALSLIAVSTYSRLILGPRLLSIAPLLLFVSLPGTWIELLKIMSENQYLFLTLTLLILMYGKKHVLEGNTYQLLMTGTVFAAVILTRTVGVALLFAVFIWSLKNYRNMVTAVSKPTYFLLGLLVPLFLWGMASDDLSSGYFQELLSLSSQDNVATILWKLFSTNVSAFISAWKGSMMIFWTDRDAIRIGIAVVLLILTLIGYFRRAAELDGLYLAIYLSILLVWPYPDEMNRFIYPILPLLIIYMIIGSQCVISWLNSKEGFVLVPVALLLAITIPANLFIYSRFKTGSLDYERDISHIPMLYKKSNPTNAVLASLTADQYMDSMGAIGKYIKKQDLVLSLKPEFLTYLGKVNAKKLPQFRQEKDREKFIRNIVNSGASHLLVTDITFPTNPMGTDIVPILEDIADVVVSQKYAYGNRIEFALLKLRDNADSF